jgi:hypothetical protein
VSYTSSASRPRDLPVASRPSWPPRPRAIIASSHRDVRSLLAYRANLLTLVATLLHADANSDRIGKVMDVSHPAPSRNSPPAPYFRPSKAALSTLAVLLGSPTGDDTAHLRLVARSKRAP